MGACDNAEDPKFAKEHDYVKYAKIDVDCGGSRGSVCRERMRPCGCGTYAGRDLEQLERHQIRFIEHLWQIIANGHFVSAGQHGVEQPAIDEHAVDQPVHGHQHGKQGTRHVEHGRHRA